MKLGDLVQLSARGKSLKCLRDCANKLGIITEVRTYGCTHSYRVMWAGSKNVLHKREELKYAK